MVKKDCHVFVMSWEGEKGIDDLIASRGTEVVREAYRTARPFTEWKVANGFQTNQQEGIDIELVQQWPVAARIAGRSKGYIAAIRRAVSGVEGGGYLGEHNRRLLFADVGTAMEQMMKRIRDPRQRQAMREAREDLKFGIAPPSQIRMMLTERSHIRGRTQ